MGELYRLKYLRKGAAEDDKLIRNVSIVETKSNMPAKDFRKTAKENRRVNLLCPPSLIGISRSCACKSVLTNSDISSKASLRADPGAMASK